MYLTRSVIFKYISAPVAWFDRHIVDGAMDGIGWTTQKLASSVRIIQSGKVQFYAWIFVMGALLVAVWALFM
jgi:NADH-quinone oxidoreductase subunit L